MSALFAGWAGAVRGRKVVQWLCAGMAATAVAFVLGMCHRWVSLVLFPYVWVLCAAPDYVAGVFLRPVAGLVSVFIPGSLNVNCGSLVLAGMVFGQFMVYALVLGYFSHKAQVRAVWVLALTHVCFVGLAAQLCMTRGWPSNADEGQHAREAGELYPNR